MRHNHDWHDPETARLLGVRALIDGEEVFLHPEDVTLVYEYPTVRMTTDLSLPVNLHVWVGRDPEPLWSGEEERDG